MAEAAGKLPDRSTFKLFQVPCGTALRAVAVDMRYLRVEYLTCYTDDGRALPSMTEV